MKKIVFLALSLFFINISIAQKCKFQSNEIDKFSGKKQSIISTTFFKNFTNRADIVFGLYQDTLFVLFNYVGATPQVISAKEGSEIAFVLGDKSVLKYTTVEDAIGKQRRTGDITECILKPTYVCTKEDLEKIKSFSITDVKMTYDQGAVIEEISSKNQDEIKHIVDCLLKEL